MADIILINPRHGAGDFGDDMGVHQPLGLMQLASNLVENGYSARLVDANAEKIADDHVLHELSQHQAKLVLITVPTVLFPSAVRIAQNIKETHPDMVVLAGGAHFVSMPHTLEGTPFDAAFVAPEGDRIIPKIAEDVLKHGKLDLKTPGLCYIKDGKRHQNPNPPLIPQTELDTIPHPYKYAKEIGFKMELYKGYGNSAVYGKGKYASIISSRGCVYKCTFCLEAEMFNRTYRYFSPQYTYDMMLDCEKLGAKEFYFQDSEWSTARLRNMELLKKMVDNKKEWLWECLSRSTDFTYNTIEYPRLMKKAGCISLIMGVESGSDVTLKRIRKSATKEDYRRAFKILRECGIERRGSFMMGYPWETEQDLKDTIDFAIELDPDFAYFQPLVPYMGTPLYEEVKPFMVVDAADDFSKWWQHSIIGGKVIVSTPQLKPEKILQMNALAYKRFYYRPTYILRQALRSWNKPYRMKIMARNAITLFTQILRKSKMEDRPAPEVV